MTKAQAPRRWSGTTLAERRAERREQLIEAGITLLAAGGAQAAGVRAVCREAGLTERYFYESFRDRDQLNAAIYEELTDECRRAIDDAVARTSGDPRELPAAAVDAVVGLVLDDPDKGRVLFVAPMTDPSLFTKRDELFPVVAEMIAEHIPPGDDEHTRRLKATTLVGALAHVFSQYVDGRLPVPREALVEHCVRLLTTVATMPGPETADD